MPRKLGKRIDRPVTKYVRLPICDMMDNALDSIRGLENGPFRLCSGGRESHFLGMLLEEAIYAAAEFAEKHKTCPWQPRFEIHVDQEGRLGTPRRREHLRRTEELDALLTKMSAPESS